MENEGKSYSVEYDEAAVRDLKKLPKKAQVQIVELVDNLSLQPRPEGVESLTKIKGLYRVRSGNYRVVYAIRDDESLVIIAAIADRKEIYKVLDRRLT